MIKTKTKKANEARARVLNTAETLFHRHGYQAVGMRDVANQLGMKQASLYYHVPDGKEQLFAEITERTLLRHYTGLQEALTQANLSLEDQLMAAAEWLISQPPMKLLAMFEADLPALSEKTRRSLMNMAYQSLFAPIAHIFEEAVSRGEIRPFDSNQLAGIFLSMMDGIMYANRAGHDPMPIRQSTTSMIDMMLFGLYGRNNSQPKPNTEGLFSTCTN